MSTPSRLLDALERTLQELEALQGIYDEDLTIEAGGRESLEGFLLEQTEQLPEEKRISYEEDLTLLTNLESATPALSLKIRLARVPDRYKPTHVEDLELHLVIPHGYLFQPEAVPLVWVGGTGGSAADFFPHDKLQNFLQELSEQREELGFEDDVEAPEILLDIAQTAKDLYDEFREECGVEAEGNTPAHADDFLGSAASPGKSSTPGPSRRGSSRKAENVEPDDEDDGKEAADFLSNLPPEQAERMFRQSTGRLAKLGRRLMYSHHIRAPSKRHLIQEYARQLNLGGFSKIGYPGVVIIEGAEEACEIYVNAISKLRWKYFCVRGEEIEEASSLSQTVDEMRKLPKSFHEFGPDDMHLLAAECRQYGVEDLFKTCMKIYKKDADGGKAEKRGPVSSVGDKKKKKR